jgi:hypothetical protein
LKTFETNSAFTSGVNFSPNALADILERIFGKSFDKIFSASFRPFSLATCFSFSASWIISELLSFSHSTVTPTISSGSMVGWQELFSRNDADPDQSTFAEWP